MKQLPPLSKAQQAAWARVLAWYAQYNNKPFTSYELRVHGVSLDALERKGMLKKHISMFITVKPEYTIHPDYLPSEPDAAPVAEAAEEVTAAFAHSAIGDTDDPDYIYKAITGFTPDADAEPADDDVFEWPIEVREVALKVANAKRAAELDALRARVAELEAASEQWEQSRDYWHTHYERAANRVSELEDKTEKMRGHIVALEQARDFWRTKHERAIVDLANEYQKAKRDTERNIMTRIEYAITRADEGKKLAAIENIIADWHYRNPAKES